MSDETRDDGGFIDHLYDDAAEERTRIERAEGAPE